MKLHKPLSRHSYRGKNGSSLRGITPYSRIAPHPSKKPPDKASLTEESKSLSGNVCTEHKFNDKHRDQHLFKQPKQATSVVEWCSSSTSDGQTSSTSSSVQDSQSVSSMNSTSSVLPTRRLHRNSTASTRRRRFLNTVEILRQSGLLDITLRTKELLRQNNATERDIAQLRQHTKLLHQAAFPQNDVTAWERLSKAMAESGNYPNLGQLQTHLDCAGQPDSISIADTNRAEGAANSGISSSYLFTSNQQYSPQGREFDTGDPFSEKVTLMPPDSSTD